MDDLVDENEYLKLILDSFLLFIVIKYKVMFLVMFFILENIFIGVYDVILGFVGSNN